MKGLPESERVKVETEIRELSLRAAKEIRETVVEARVSGKYEAYNWTTETVANQVKHAAEHLRLYALGDRSEPHLAHATTRLAIAFGLIHRGSEG